MEFSTREADERCNIEKYWEEIGIQLEVDYRLLKTIWETHHVAATGTLLRRDYCNLAFRDMIAWWLKKKGSPPSWLNLVEALECLKKFPGFANHLREKYCTYTYLCS